MTIKNILTTRLSELDLQADHVELIAQYVELLLKVNKRISLTRVADFHTWFISHVEDSVRAYRVFEALKAEYFIDSGSGNGLPGVIFGILSGKPFTLCDVDVRKCEFLKTACYRLKLPGKVYCGPIEDLANTQEDRLCFVYRGLGPDHFLVNQYALAPQAGHFRFISSDQESLFKGSKVEEYKLSDESSRFLEISPIK